MRVLHAHRQIDEALTITGLPAIVRPAFTLGGHGGGFALTEVTAGTVYKVVTTGCSAGTLKLMVPAGSAKAR